jgi:hypothetical protein
METFVEQDCVFRHDGREFSSGGAVVSDHYIVAYLGRAGVLTDWHGNRIGTWTTLSSWRTPRSFVSDRMYSVECYVNSVRFVGRSAGEGMIVRAKRSPKQDQLG